MGSEIERLETSKSCAGVADSHSAVEEFYKSRNEEMEQYVNIIRGRIQTNSHCVWVIGG